MQINKEKCKSCGACWFECPFGAVKEDKGSFTIDEAACKNCGICCFACLFDAIEDERKQ